MSDINVSMSKSDARSLLKKSKELKETVNYRPGKSNGKICHECKSYKTPGQVESACVRVIGMVDEAATCDRWEKAPATEDRPGPSQTVTVTVKL